MPQDGTGVEVRKECNRHALEIEEADLKIENKTMG